MNPVLERISAGRLVWLPEAGCGYYECEQPEAAQVYDQAYFDRFAAQADTVTGRALMTARAELVRRYAGPDPMAIGRLVDVGIGSGAFIELMAAQGVQALGYDVNPAGVAWLEAREAYVDLYRQGPWETVTFWDALEHIREPDKALARCAGWVFVALPIFRDCAHVLGSKHLRKDEHYWYWTREGFRRFAEAQGFRVIDITATETALGRDDVETFVLRRR